MRHGVADYGVSLEFSEQKTRYLIKSLLRAEGVADAAYQERFHGALWADFPQLNELIDGGLARLQLTEEGLAWSDTIGPWLYSEAVAGRMNAYEFA